MSHTINVTLNTMDEEGEIVDTTNMDVTNEDASNIIDRAAEFLVRARENRDNGKDGLDGLAVDALDELEEALDSANVI